MRADEVVVAIEVRSKKRTIKRRSRACSPAACAAASLGLSTATTIGLVSVSACGFDRFDIFVGED